MFPYLTDRSAVFIASIDYVSLKSEHAHPTMSVSKAVKAGCAPLRLSVMSIWLISQDLLALDAGTCRTLTHALEFLTVASNTTNCIITLSHQN